MKTAVRMYWPVKFKHSWCWLKAQAIAESGLNPTAVSYAGARGLIQIMPRTWSELQSEVRQAGGIFSARANIIQGARYMRKMMDFWISPRSWLCQLELALASYNAGATSIHRAQIKSGMARCWADIKPHLRKVTGRHSRETIGYVDKIQRYHRILTQRGRA